MDCGLAVPQTLLDSREKAVQESMDLWQEWNGQAGGRIRYAFCPRFAISCSDGLLREVATLSLQHGIPVHTHASENQGEIALVERERGQRNILYLDGLGLCNARLILAHCIHLNTEEMSILAASQTNISHCPSSNLKLGSGIAKIPELLAMDAGFPRSRWSPLQQQPQCFHGNAAGRPNTKAYPWASQHAGSAGF